jgi:hypothetical protein
MDSPTGTATLTQGARPRSPKFSVRRCEFDPSWLVIRALATIGLVAIIGAQATLADGGLPSANRGQRSAAGSR